jgi:choline dehydrogenase-like flavoprotein
MNDAVIDASRLDHDLTLEADVAIVGTGAGGATAAAILARAGQSVVMLEEGGYYTRADFRMREAEAYPSLYQELGARKTKDNAISILQGRCVGGTTVVNWTSSFRIPEQTLAVWREQFGLSGYTETELAPWYEQTAQALNIGPWEIPPNPNNAALKRGAERLGWSVHGLKRNVKACANLGYCGVGCPIDAKQSMLVTRVPEALAHGARLIHHARAERFEWRGDTVAALHVSALDDTRTIPNGRRIQVRARRFIAAGAGPVAALGPAGSPRSDRSTDFPASIRLQCRADAGAHRGLGRRAAERLCGRVHLETRCRWPDGLQDRGAAAAAGPGTDRPAEFRR